MKKIYFLLIYILLAANVVVAQTDGGTFGENGEFSWTVEDDVLTITGEGRMPDFNIVGEISYDTPWHLHNESVLEIVIEDGITSIGEGAFHGFYNLLAVTIPEDVTSIGADAFRFCFNLRMINLPVCLTSIGGLAFCGCEMIENIKIPNSVTSIIIKAFLGCTALNTVEVQWETPLSVENIFDSTTMPSSTLIVPDGTKNLYQQADVWKEFKTITEKSEVYPPYGTFGENGEFSWTVEDDVLTITGEGRMPDFNIVGEISYDAPWHLYCQFHNYKVREVVISDGITSIGQGAFFEFYDASSVTIPNSVTSIGREAFTYWCALLDIKFPENLDSIGLWAFYGCQRLKTINIPKSVTSIATAAFAFCSALNMVEVQWDTPLLVDIFDAATLSSATLIVPDGTKSLYQQANVWKEFKTIKEKSEITAIEAIDEDEISIAMIPSGIIIRTDKALPASIYSLTGQKEHESIITGQKEISLPQGIHIFRVGERSGKIVIR
ncbi:MAG: leucine-rich repeat domain-containing protein [Dysgonamonadaceae bacterium]|jgi:hypothetical protein|nr:leucine-rich repeat domain-containing protein [Dysgonamonadaceae bacterium]